MATLTETQSGPVTIVRLSGGLTFEGVVPVQRAFETATTRGQVVIDLTGVPVVTTPGLSMLLGAQKRMSHAGGRLVLAGMSTHVSDMLRRCRLDKVFKLAANIDSAVTGLSASQE